MADMPPITSNVQRDSSTEVQGHQEESRLPRNVNQQHTTESPDSQLRNKRPSCEQLGIVKDRPKHKNYTTVQARFQSFKNWPPDKTQSAHDLAVAGFAYTGVGDSVRCYNCDIGLKDWPYGACAWEQHVIASPKCGHVINCKGRTFIKKILNEEESDSDVDDSEEVVDIVKVAMKKNEDAIEAARSVFPADDDTLRTAVKSLIHFDIQKKFTGLQLAEVIQTLQENTGEADEGSESENEEDESEAETEADEEKNRSLKEPITCKICFDALACIVTLPCGHMVSCSQCISALTACAMCRQPIKGTVRALMAV